MKSNRKTILLIAIGLLLFSLGCLGSKAAAPTATLPPTTAAPATATSVKATNTATPTAAPTQPQTTVTLGDTQRSDEGGFSIRAVPGYQLIPFGGLLSMLAPGADPDTGPVVTVVGGTVDETTNQDLYNQLKSGTPLTVGPAEPIVVQGAPGLAADLSGENNGKPMRGRVALVMVTPTHQFILLLGAPQAQWDEVAPLFDALLASVEFFAPTEAELPVAEAPTAIPVPPATSGATAGRYPYTNPNVARDVLVYDSVVYAATLGGMVIWEVSPTLEDGFPTVYTPLDGLSHVSTHALILCDVPISGGRRATRIVIGTLTGLSFYDPLTGLWDATPITPSNSNVQTTKIDRLYCDAANNRLLIGYSGLGILNLETGAWQRFTDKEGLSWNAISDIAVTGSDIWVASGYNGISKISGDKVTIYDESNGLPNKRANALAVGTDGALWVGTSGGLARFKNDQWAFYTAKEVSGLADIRRLALADDGTLWVGSSSLGGGNLCRFDPAAGKCIENYPDPQGVLGLTLYHTGAPLWANSDGVHALVEKQKHSFKIQGILPATNFIDSFAAAPDGSLWMGTDGGIHRLDPANPDAPWETWTRADGIGKSSSWTAALAVAPDGAVWAAIINGDASRFRDGKWTTYEGLRSYESVAIDAQGRAWFGKKDKGIVVLNADGSKALDLTTAQGLPTDNVLALLADGDTMWIALDVGLARYTGGKAELVLDKSTLPHPYLRALALDTDGTLLVGANLSIVHYDGNQVQVLYNLQKEGFRGWLNELAVTPDGTIWAGTQNGVLYSADGRTWTHLTTADGLLTNFISALHVDQYGGVWIGGGSNTAGGGLLHIVK